MTQQTNGHLHWIPSTVWPNPDTLLYFTGLNGETVSGSFRITKQNKDREPVEGEFVSRETGKCVGYVPSMWRYA